MVDLTALFERTAEFHKQLCPRQVLGVRIGLMAGTSLGLDLPQTNKRLYALVETDGCAADGISVASGCWVGRRTMRVIDYGKVAATFVDTWTGSTVRISPHPAARSRARAYAPDAPDSWHAQLAAYQVMPDAALLVTRPVTLTISLEKLISQPGLRVRCDHCAEEIMNAREVSESGRILCRACAGKAYYRHEHPDST